MQVRARALGVSWRYPGLPPGALPQGREAVLFYKDAVRGGRAPAGGQKQNSQFNFVLLDALKIFRLVFCYNN